MAKTERTSTINAPRAMVFQELASASFFDLVVLKYAKVATNEATRESVIKKCPNIRGNKCSPV